MGRPSVVPDLVFRFLERSPEPISARDVSIGIGKSLGNVYIALRGLQQQSLVLSEDGKWSVIPGSVFGVPVAMDPVLVAMDMDDIPLAGPTNSILDRDDC